MSITISRLMQVAAWIGIVGLAVASWTPGQSMVRTSLNGLLEHVIAYLLTGIALMLGYQHRSPWILAASLAAYAAILEAGQMLVPGRHAGLLDWAAGALGALCASLLIVAVSKRDQNP